MSIINSNQWSAIKDEINNNALPRAGGSMDGNKITNLGDATDDADAVNLKILKNIRPFAMQLMSFELNSTVSSLSIPLNNEFKQGFANYCIIRLGASDNFVSILVPSGGSIEGLILAYTNSTGRSDYLDIAHNQDDFEINFKLTKNAGVYNSYKLNLLVVGIN